MKTSATITTKIEYGGREFLRRLGIPDSVHVQSVKIETPEVEWESTPWTKAKGRYRFRVITTRYE